MRNRKRLLLDVNLRKVRRGHPLVLDVPSLGEVVRVVQVKVAVVNLDVLTDDEVLVSVRGRALRGAEGVNFQGLVGERLAPEEHGEGIAAAVGLRHLEDLHGIVCEVVVHDERPLLAVQSAAIVPHGEEPEHLSVVGEKLLELIGGERVGRLARGGLDVSGEDIVAGRGRVRVGARVLLERRPVSVDGIIRVRAVRGHLQAQGAGEVLAGERVAGDDEEGASVHGARATDGYVRGAEHAALVVLGHPVALEEDALGDAAVRLPGLLHVNRLVLEVHVDGALAHAVVLHRALGHGLLEVAVPAKHLASKGIGQGQPGRREVGEIDRFGTA